MGANNSLSIGSDKDKEDGRRVNEAIDQKEQSEVSLVHTGLGMNCKGKKVVEMLEHVRVYEEVDKGEASHSSLHAEVPPVMMDIVTQEEPVLSVDNLINIPIDLSTSRGVLQEVTVSALEIKKRDSQIRDKTAKGTWKRMRGKENMDQTNTESKSSNNETGGKKRQWTL